MRVGILFVLTAAGLFVGGCYVMEYNYDPYYDGYYSDSYYPSRSAVRYYSPVEPLLDLAVLGAVLYGWHNWTPRYHRAPSYRYAPSSPVSRIRR